jgi:ABC-type multidrug transport system ATPase subunit
MEAPVLELKGVGKAFGRSALFRNVDLSVRRGACVALTGRNGAGKTTVLRIAAGLAAATEGEVRRVKGLSIGYVPEHFPKLNLTARQFIRHMGAIEGLDRSGIEEGMGLFSDFFMDDLIDLPMGRLSKGTLQKVAVVQALMRPRGLLLLDEPLSGQDEKSQRAFVEKVLERKRAGAAVLLSCHEPLLAERLADGAYRLDAGGLTPVRAGEGAPRALLAFEPDREAQFPPEVQSYRSNGRLYASAPRDICDRLIVEMIEKGYTLREMRDEDGV